jgi:hypothetical protein
MATLRSEGSTRSKRLISRRTDPNEVLLPGELVFNTDWFPVRRNIQPVSSGHHGLKREVVNVDSLMKMEIRVIGSIDEYPWAKILNSLN